MLLHITFFKLFHTTTLMSDVDKSADVMTTLKKTAHALQTPLPSPVQVTWIILQAYNVELKGT